MLQRDLGFARSRILHHVRAFEAGGVPLVKLERGASLVALALVGFICFRMT